MTEKASSEIIDYRSFREDHLDNLSEWDFSDSFGQNIINLINQSVILPHARIQTPVIAAYASIPSAMATVVPILFIHGERGSGKSNLGFLFSGIHQVDVQNAAGTFAGLRNHINQIRWRIIDDFVTERNYCLVLDNINYDTLVNESLYTLLLNGYNRKTDRIVISKGNGENMDFQVFGLKVLTTVHPLFNDIRFKELSRRCLVIRCKPFEKFLPTERDDSIDVLNISERLDFETVDFAPVRNSFDTLWSNRENLGQYVTLKRSLGKRKKSFELPKSITGERLTISVDLVVAGIIAGVWENHVEAFDCLDKYWQWFERYADTQFGATHKVLADFIETETALIKKANEQIPNARIPLEISPPKLRQHLLCAANQGTLDCNPVASLIAKYMADLHWKLDKGYDGSMKWIPADQ